MKRILTIVLVLAAIFIAGCGGGGGGNGGGSNIAPPNNQPDPPVAPGTFTIEPGKEAVLQVDTITVNVPAETFPAGAEVTISRTIPSAAEMPPVGELACNKIEITASKMPQGSITITTNGLALQTMGVQKQVYLLVKKVGDLWTKVADSETGKFVIDATEFAVDGPIVRAGLIIGKIFINEPSSEAIMVQFGGNDTSETVIANSTLVIVHGFSDNAESLKLLAQRFANLHEYSQIYLFGYDWRNKCDLSAEKLGEELDTLKDQGKQIDIAAHSMGVVVSRYALERLGKTKSVNNLFAINGANLGSVWATPASFLLGLQNDYINRLPGDHLLNGFPIGNIESINDLVPGSQFLTTLNNSDTKGQCGLVNYCLISSVIDLVVGQASSSADGVPLKSLTAGIVERYMVNGFGHADLVKTPAGTMEVIIAAQNMPSQDQVVFLGSQVSIESTWDGWHYEIQIGNISQADAYLTDLRIDYFNRYGNWVGVNWYDPNVLSSDDFYPSTYIKWDKRLRSSEDVTLYLHTWPDANRSAISEVPDDLKSCILVFTLRYSGDLGPYTTTTTKRLYTKGIGLDMPKTRSLLDAGTSEAQGYTGPSKR